jgi:sugar lactone lactonase YvrE
MIVSNRLLKFGAAAGLALAAASLAACGSSTSTAEPAPLTDPLAGTATTLKLPGDRFYPESVSASPDGTLYVGSLGTGQVVAFARGQTTAKTVVAGGDPKGVSGVLADAASSTLWLCAVDLSATPPASELRAYDLATGSKKTSYPFDKPAFCNDLVLDDAGNLFVADSFGGVWELKKGARALAIWKRDPLLAASSPSGFGADGIALDGKGSMFVNTFSDGRLLKIAINGDGSAGALSPITVNPPLSAPDGMRMLDANTLVLVDGTAGTLLKVALGAGGTATATTVASGLKGPTSLARVGETYWVTEGQLGTLLGAPGSPELPFGLRAVTAR